MTGTPRGRQIQYQPPLPGTADAVARASASGRRTGAPGRASATPARASATSGRPRSTERREHPAPADAPRRSAAGNQSWRLDEKTRRAGRQGVAAARAALARVAQTGPDRQADAA